MTALQQILFGTGLLLFSAMVHVSVVSLSIPYFAKLSSFLPNKTLPRLRNVIFFTSCNLCSGICTYYSGLVVGDLVPSGHRIARPIDQLLFCDRDLHDSWPRRHRFKY
ncbi:hypothetical protein KUV51_00595 [Tateyamaria omphalii]|uniref:hypothetical protein n=1 Tax=Tateyamaria omphalii TaxID=299262 RepID=UPI001C98FEF0|nr:hypothetical protein [Tateyamaria omphalii]MBY5931479.1 hypothetical protein [Tateyamaria omphalii]